MGATKGVLDEATVYLSGPMDFVASRQVEKETGWRNRVTDFVKRMGVTVYDPWFKPGVAGFEHTDYGKEDEFTTAKRKNWTFEDSEQGDRTRAELCSDFWPTLHIDLRMTDTADFLIAYVPTNIYSVGTVHEIVMARLQHKPVLFVSPSVTFPSNKALEEHLAASGDDKGLELLNELKGEAPLRENPSGIPSMWYMALVDAHYFFDGFGWAQYHDEFGWPKTHLDEREETPPQRPLLPYLEKLNKEIPHRFDAERNEYVVNDEWLIFKTSDLDS